MDEYIQMLDKRRLHYLGPDMLEKTSFFDLYLSAQRLKHCNNGAYEDTCGFYDAKDAGTGWDTHQPD